MRTILISSLLALSIPTVAKGQTCDPKLQEHVYHPKRLTHLSECTIVTGTVIDATHGRQKDGVRHEKDGDSHGWLKLDPPYQHLLNNGNKQFEDGNLVFEIPCLFPVTQPDAVASCKDWTEPIALPPVGAHIKMWGVLVRETNHGKWIEIHPVSGWDVIPTLTKESH